MKVLFIFCSILALFSIFPEEEIELPKKTLLMIPSGVTKEKAEIDKLFIEAYKQIENSDKVLYFELPDTLDDTDPEEVLTFGKKIRSDKLIVKLKELLEKGRADFTKKPTNCKLYYSNAFVFYSKQTRESILFSQNCRILKLREQEIYLNFAPYSTELDQIFREVRRLR
jgi:hypothetical protein